MNDDQVTSSQPTGDAPGKSGAQQRIDQLVKRASDSERNTQRLGEENAQLLAQVSTLAQTVEELKRTQATPSASTAHEASPAQPAGTSSSTPDIQKMIQEGVTKAIGDLVAQNQAQQAEQAKLVAAQNSAFDVAAQDMPALLEGTSEERRLFDQVFTSMPELNTSARGPILAAEIVRGAISTARRGQRKADSTKTQASIHRPADLIGSLDSADGTPQEKAMAQVEALHKKGMTQGLRPEEMGAYVVAAMQTRPSED
jgi:hypothetical protein